uniref:RCK N-terminal domain-containing protein n=1 Tax=Archaeoglobus fulgidus TaxID=2234 RepID=A0A7J2TK33_ARCFL
MRILLVLIGRDESFENLLKDLEVDLRFLDRNADIQSFADSLRDYDRIIIAATLGSWQGELLIELAMKCRSEILFFCLTKSGSINEAILSRIQADRILKISPNFQGVIISEEMPEKAKLEALKTLTGI